MLFIFGKKLLTIAIASIIGFSLIITPALAELDTTETKGLTLSTIEDVTNTILKKELDLLGFDTKFRLAATSSMSKGKPWRIFADKLAASSLTEAGITTVAVSRWKYYPNPKLASRSLLKAGPICNLTGASLVVGGSLLEGILDQVHDSKLRQNGLDGESALKHFMSLRSDIDTLMSQREQMLPEVRVSDIQKQVLEADGAVLKDVRDLASIQFADYYARNKRYIVTRDTNTLLSLAGAGVGGYMGSLNSLLAVSNRNPKQGGVAGIAFIISGSIVSMTPILTKTIGIFATKAAERKMRKTVKMSMENNLSNKTPDNFEADLQKLLTLLDKAEGAELTLMKGLDARTSAYALQKSIFENQNAIAARQAEKRSHAFRERLVFSSIVGGTNVARGIQLAIAGFRYSDNPSNAFKLTAIASTTFMVGAGTWIFDTLQDRIRAELLTKKAKTAQLSTQIQLQQRLEDIEEMEETVSLY